MLTAFLRSALPGRTILHLLFGQAISLLHLECTLEVGSVLDSESVKPKVRVLQPQAVVLTHELYIVHQTDSRS